MNWSYQMVTEWFGNKGDREERDAEPGGRAQPLATGVLATGVDAGDPTPGGRTGPLAQHRVNDGLP